MVVRHDVVLQLGGHLRVRLMLLHVNGGQGLGPTQYPVVQSREYVALEIEYRQTHTVRWMRRRRRR